MWKKRGFGRVPHIFHVFLYVGNMWPAYTMWKKCGQFSQALLWNLYGKYMEFTWKIHGIYVGNIGKKCGKGMENIGKMDNGKSMDFMRKICGFFDRNKTRDFIEIIHIKYTLVYNKMLFIFNDTFFIIYIKHYSNKSTMKSYKHNKFLFNFKTKIVIVNQRF